MEMQQTSKSIERTDRVKKLPVVAEACLCDAATPFETLLEWDRDGKRIAFAHEGADWKELDAKELEQLSAFTKGVYGIMRKQHEAYDPVANEEQASIKVTGQAMGSSIARRAAPLGASKGLVLAGFRPDQLEGAYERGFRAARPGEIKAGAVLKDGHYEMVRASDGSTEQIWLVKDRDQHEADDRAKDAEVMADSGRRFAAAEEEVARTGYKAVHVDEQ